MSARLSILFAGGGTAGHLLPAIATEGSLRKSIASSTPVNLEVTYLSTRTGPERKILHESGARYRIVPKTDLPRKIGIDLFTFPLRLIVALMRALPLVRQVDIVIGFGGYVALPAYLAAFMLRKPLIIHEANALPGLANRVGRRFASRAVANFPIAGWEERDVIGLPIRESIWRIGTLTPEERLEQQQVARSKFGLEKTRKTILVFGGSLGAAKINEALSDCLDRLLANGYQVLHSTGVGKAVIAKRAGYHPVSFISEMEQAYLASDLVIARSGAGTCAEILALGVPAILVPLAIGNGEQHLNANQVAQARGDGSVIVIENKDLDGELLTRSISELIDIPFTSNDVKISAADRLAQMIIEYGFQR